MSLSQVEEQNSGGPGWKLHLPQITSRGLQRTRDKGLSLGHTASQGHAFL